MKLLGSSGRLWEALGGSGRLWEQQQEAGTPPPDGRRVAARWPPDGQILSGGVAWQAGGQEAKKPSKNPILQAKFGE